MVSTLNILLLEDDSIEIMKFNRVINSLNLSHKVFEANNGLEALDILKTKEVIPDIIILDLNMPKLNGLEFLKILKANENLRYIPSIILSTSSNHKDLLECFKAGIAGYIVKPLKYEEYVDKIKKLLDYWSINEIISR